MPSPLFEVLANRRGGAAFGSVFLSAAAIGTANLAILQFIEFRTDSYVVAGAVLAFFTLGNAVGLIVQGHLLDRLTTYKVLVPASVIFASILIAVTQLPVVNNLTYIVAFMAAGASLPATTGAVRASLPSLYEPDTRLSAYSVLTVTFQAGIALGPTVASLLYPYRADGYPLLATAAIATAATLLPIPVKTRPTHATTEKQPRVKTRIKFSPGYVTILIAALAVGIASGFMGIGIPAAFDRVDAAAIVGFAFTASAAGDLLAGGVYGARRWPGAIHTHFTVSLFAGGLTGLVLILSLDLPIVVILVMLVSGAIGAPIGITSSALLDSVVPQSQLAISYTIMVAISLVATSIGNWLAGASVEALPLPLVLLAAPLLMLGASGFVLARRHSLQSPANLEPLSKQLD